MNRAVDFHSHILPRMDDGSASPEESIAMLRLSAEQGIGHIVATPHFRPRHDSLEGFLEMRRRREGQLREEMAKYSGLPQLSMGAEVQYFRGISESDFLEKLTISGKRCILIELPPAPWPETVYRELGEIRARQGIVPVIAHVDRYIGPFRTYDIPRRLAELPVLVQANAEFFLRRSTSSMALKMLKSGQIHLLGSDCHNMSARKPNLGPALQLIQRKLDREALSRIHSYEQMLLDMAVYPSERNGVRE